MLNYLKKFALEILPSVAATVIGAYIVNHYIVSKPATDAPVAAAVSSADGQEDPPKPANLPEPGVKAKGISERAMMEKSASEKPGEFKPAETHASEAKASDKPSEVKSTETASAPAEPRRHAILPAPREKTVARTAAPAPAAVPRRPGRDRAATPRKITAMPTIWRERRSSVCATASPRIGESQDNSRKRRAPWRHRACRKRREPSPRLRRRPPPSARCRRRSR